MKYTKKQRHEIYKKALKSIKDGSVGLCCAIDDAIYGVNGAYKEDDVLYNQLKQFKEIMRQEPTEWFSDRYWFSWDDREPRIKILKQAIKETK